MKKVLQFLKQNVTFFVILAIALVFYFIALFGGDYQTVTFSFEVKHYTFLNGVESGVPLALTYVIAPIICLVGIGVLYFIKPAKRDGKKATIFVGSLIALATVAGLFIGMIPVALFNQSEPTVIKMTDWASKAAERVFFVKTFNFPYLSMVLSLFATIVLGCYASSTLSD